MLCIYSLVQKINKEKIMAKKKKRKKLGLVLMIAGIVGIVFSMQHFGIIAFSGNGNLGWGASMQPGTVNVKQLKFYFSENTIYQGKQKISKEDFLAVIQKAKEKDESIDLYVVQSKLSNEFYNEIKAMIDKIEVVFSEDEISIEKMPK